MNSLYQIVNCPAPELEFPCRSLPMPLVLTPSEVCSLLFKVGMVQEKTPFSDSHSNSIAETKGSSDNLNDLKQDTFAMLMN
jgi:uncharacterized Zn-finger protein